MFSTHNPRTHPGTSVGRELSLFHDGWASHCNNEILWITALTHRISCLSVLCRTIMSVAPAVIASPLPQLEETPDKILKGSLPSPSMEKQDRKKLKKLRKRATNVISDGEKSGISTQSEWMELQKLVAMGTEEGTDKGNETISFGPAISRRKRKEASKVEGSHHRDLVAWFMDQICHPNNGPQPKKRVRKNQDGGEDDELQNPKIPSWASIHNAASVERIVVLEVQLSSSQSQVEKCQSIVDMAVAQSKRRTTLHLPTKWFQGPAPKTQSESLLYFANSNHNRRPKEEQEGTASMGQLMRDMEEMILPLDNWSIEGYPVPIEAEISPEYATVSPIASSTESLQDYDSIPIMDSKEFVSRCGFRIEHQKDEDMQLFISTKAAGGGILDAPSPSRVFGMDCEMVLTSLGSELARITLVQLTSFENSQLETTTVLDALVKPENPVKDYLTRHSGITAELLDPVSTRLEQIQVALRQFLRPTDILVGHSLENDLMAAHYIHPRVIDTSLIFRHRNKRTKFSLRHMSASLLKKTIQRGSHCSKEDAEATLELAIRRAWLGDAFALPNTDERRSLLEKWNSDKEMKMVCIGPSSWLQTHVTNQTTSAHALGCDSVAECKKALLAWTKGPRQSRLTWCQMNIAADDVANDFEALQQLLVR